MSQTFALPCALTDAHNSRGPARMSSKFVGRLPVRFLRLLHRVTSCIKRSERVRHQENLGTKDSIAIEVILGFRRMVRVLNLNPRDIINVQNRTSLRTQKRRHYYIWPGKNHALHSPRSPSEVNSDCARHENRVRDA